jgi:inhibitor of cysteine peptidase
LTFSLNGLIKSTISGTVNWQQKIFTLPTGTHTLVWKYTKNATINGGSDAAWIDKVVVSPNTALKVTSPNGKENLVSGSTVTITWNAPAAAEKYGLSYSMNNGTTWIPIPGASAPNYLISPDFTNITYPWNMPVPSSNTSTCKVKVVAYNAANAVVGTDISDVSFAINNVRLTSPNGGNMLVAGGTHDITWENTAGAASFNLFYSLNNGTTWLPIAGNVTGVNDYLWTVPVPPAGNMTTCKVKIVAYNNASAVIGTSISAAPFKITVLTVTSPNGGESFNPQANPATINFVVTGLTNSTASATLSYSLTGGVSWVTISKIPGGIAPGPYSYPWNVPASTALKTACRVRVVITSGTGAVLASDTSNANFTIQPVFTLSGIATLNGKALPGVTMTLGGDDSATTTTDALGKYSFTTLLKGNYTVSASLAGYVFNPAVTAFSITTVNIATANFAARSTSDTSFYTLSGTVSGATYTNVTLVLSGTLSGTVMTDGSGNYAFSNLPEGNYNVTPAKAGFTFGPLSTGASLTIDTTGINFTSSTGAGATYSMSGKASYNGAGLPGVTMTLGGTAGATVMTDSNGNYTIKGLKNGAYTLTPSMSGYDFTPVSTSKTIAGANITGINFSSGRNSGALSGTYTYVAQTAGFYEYGSGPVFTASMVSTGTGTIAFNGSGGCSITHTDIGYDMMHDTNTLSPSPSNGSGQDVCTYVVAPDGTLTVSIGGNVAFTGLIGADGNTILSGGPYINGTVRGSDQMVLIKTGSSTTASSLSGTYTYVAQTAGFYEYGSGPVFTASMVSTGTGTIAFNGSGGCSITHTDIGYDMMHDTNTLSPSPSNGSGRTSCTYTVVGNGSLTVKIGSSIAFKGMIGDDGSTIISGGPYINGTLRGSDQMFLIK